jgi:hypothetical protein
MWGASSSPRLRGVSGWVVAAIGISLLDLEPPGGQRRGSG